jgi:peptide/nickel transport system substrate-binding protein
MLSIIAVMSVIGACGREVLSTPTLEPTQQEPTSLPVTEPEPTLKPTETPESSRIVLAVGWDGDLIDCLNPAACSKGWPAWDLLYDSLVGWGAVAEGEVIPRLAEDWQSEPGSMQISFQLTDLEGVTFHDGTPLTAEDVAWSLNYYAQNEQLSWLLGTTVGSGFGAEVMEESTVSLRLIEPINSNVLLSYLTNVYILPSHIWGEYEGASISDFENLEAIGSGPYRLVDWVPGEYIAFRAHEHYHQGSPPVDEIIVQFFPDSGSLLESLARGGIDLVSSLRPRQVEPLVEDEALLLAEKSPINGYMLVFNLWEEGIQHSALLDRVVRRAIAHAIDKEELVDIVEAGDAVPADSVWDGGARFDRWAHPDLSADEFDLDQAGEMLEAGGYRDADEDGVREVWAGSGEPLNFRLAFSTRTPEPGLAAGVISDWLQEIGIEVELQGLEEDQLIQQMRDGEYDLAIDRSDLSWDPDLALYRMTSWALDANVNHSGYSDVELDSMYLAQHYALSESERRDYIHIAQEIIHADVPWIQLYHYQAFDAVRHDRFRLTRTDTYGQIWGWYGIWGFESVGGGSAAGD